jgi:hypothetical protein
VFTTSSDCQLARKTLFLAAKEVVGDYLNEAQISWKTISDNYRSANPPLEPTISLVVYGGYLEFAVSYVVDYDKRTAIRDHLFTKIVEEVARSGGRLEWAVWPVTSLSQLANPDTIEVHASASTHAAGDVRESR